nr:hypothetical protein [Comamonas testosteroni]
MLVNKKYIIAVTLSLLSTLTMSQTIGDIAAFQRAKAQAEIKGEQALPDAVNSKQTPAEVVSNQTTPRVKQAKTVHLLGTFNVDGVPKALISNGGSVSPIAVGESVNQYSVRNITSKNVTFAAPCKTPREKKSKCKTLTISVGGGL